MSATYKIRVDRERRLFSLTLTGFFEVNEVAALLEDVRAAVASFPQANQHVTLCDVSECKLQPQEVIGAFQAHLSEARFRSRRLAFVTGASLARMQVRRLLERGHARCFDTVAEAEAWLSMSEDARRAA